MVSFSRMTLLSAVLALVSGSAFAQQNRASIAFYAGDNCPTTDLPTVIQTNSAQCQVTGTTSYIINCSNGGGTGSFCADTKCSQDCRNVSVFVYHVSW